MKHDTYQIPIDIDRPHLILDTREEIQYFLIDLNRLGIVGDMVEIMHQIFDVLQMNNAKEFDRLDSLPQINRLSIDTITKINSQPELFNLFKNSLFTFSFSIKTKLMKLNVYDEHDAFPYTFIKFIGEDLLLRRLID